MRFEQWGRPLCRLFGSAPPCLLFLWSDGVGTWPEPQTGREPCSESPPVPSSLRPSCLARARARPLLLASPAAAAALRCAMHHEVVWCDGVGRVRRVRRVPHVSCYARGKVCWLVCVARCAPIGHGLRRARDCGRAPGVRDACTALLYASMTVMQHCTRGICCSGLGAARGVLLLARNGCTSAAAPHACRPASTRIPPPSCGTSAPGAVPAIVSVCEAAVLRLGARVPLGLLCFHLDATCSAPFDAD